MFTLKSLELREFQGEIHPAIPPGRMILLDSTASVSRNGMLDCCGPNWCRIDLTPLAGLPSNSATEYPPAFRTICRIRISLTPYFCARSARVALRHRAVVMFKFRIS